MICDSLAASGNYSIICLLPILVLMVLILAKVPIIPAVLGSSISAIIIAVLNNGVSVSEIVSNAWNGYTAQTGNDIVDAALSGGGVMGTTGTVLIIFGSSFFAAMLVITGIPDIILEKASYFCSTKRSLAFTTVIANLFILIATGSIYTSMTLMGNMFKKKYDEMGLGRSALSMIVYPFQNMVTVFLPWSVISSTTFALIGYSGSYYAIMPYIIGTFTSIGLLLVCIAMGKFDFFLKKAQ